MAASLRLLRRWVEAVNSCKVKPGDPIDALTAWLLASRSCSLTMTFTSSMIGGLLALEAGYFNLIVFGLTLVALLFAHAANNMLNDFYDYRYGLDTLDYFRAQYAPHPILSNLMSVDALKLGGVLATTLAGAIALYLTAIRRPLILLFALLGSKTVSI